MGMGMGRGRGRGRRLQEAAMAAFGFGFGLSSRRNFERKQVGEKITRNVYYTCDARAGTQQIKSRDLRIFSVQRASKIAAFFIFSPPSPSISTSRGEINDERKWASRR